MFDINDITMMAYYRDCTQCVTSAYMLVVYPYYIELQEHNYNYIYFSLDYFFAKGRIAIHKKNILLYEKKNPTYRILPHDIG